MGRRESRRKASTLEEGTEARDEDATYGWWFDLANAGPLGDRPYLGDVGEGIVELVVARLEYRCFWRHRELKVGLGAIAGHILSATVIPAAAALVAPRSHGSGAVRLLFTLAGTHATHFKFERSTTSLLDRSRNHVTTRIDHVPARVFPRAQLLDNKRCATDAIHITCSIDVTRSFAHDPPRLITFYLLSASRYACPPPSSPTPEQPIAFSLSLSSQLSRPPYSSTGSTTAPSRRISRKIRFVASVVDSVCFMADRHLATSRVT